MSQSTRVTDGQTDRQTDRILIARPRLHFMQRGKNPAVVYVGAGKSSSLVHMFFRTAISPTGKRPHTRVYEAEPMKPVVPFTLRRNALILYSDATNVDIDVQLWISWPISFQLYV